MLLQERNRVGYDGRGQGKVGFGPEAGSEAEVRGAWEALGEGAGVVEQAVALEREISVMVARSPRGEVKVYPAAWNHHEHQILSWSVIPAAIPETLEAEAREIAWEIADTFQLEGLLAVEMFVTTDGDLLVNELAPRPHNSYHQSERAVRDEPVRAGGTDSLRSSAWRRRCGATGGDRDLLGDHWIAEGWVGAGAAIRPGAGRSRGEAASLREAEASEGEKDGASERGGVDGEAGGRTCARGEGGAVGGSFGASNRYEEAGWKDRHGHNVEILSRGMGGSVAPGLW